MKEFQEQVNVALAKMIDGGKLTEIIDAQIKKTVAEIVTESLRSYSDFGRQLGEVLKSSLNIDAQRLGLEGYNKIVLRIVKEKLDDAIITVGAKKIADEMDKLLGTDAPKEIKLSELIEEFKEDLRKDDSHNHYSCTVILEEQGRFSHRWLYMDPGEKVEKYRCRYSMLIGTDNGIVTVHKLEHKDAKDTLILGTLYGFSRRMFQIYATGTKIIIDTEDVDGSLGGDD